MGPSILSHAEAKAHQVINPLPSGGGLWTKQPSVTIRPFHAALDALGIRRRRRYDARHTYATMCLMAGMHPAFIAKQLAIRYKFSYPGMPVGSTEKAIGTRWKS
ncbi:hypothetical protein B381_09966 [Stutzerimonas stutzeri NF13]|jgi:hypothetical protein|uniref:Phage integrase family protein n=1 Tax=Stutzerimonas stutzeri NF13 TaxID=1212548 RepID=M2TT20_STUST|nr:hypothetical protein B381_09966 [Stutzerimonas stutzeri NF13]